MVVNESIKVEKIECIKRGVHCDRPVDKTSGPCDRHEMSGANDTVNVDDLNVRRPAVQNIWLNHPTACIFVGFGTHKGIPLNECTRILFVAMQKREEKENSGYLESAGTINVGFDVDEDTIVACRAISPR